MDVDASSQLYEQITEKIILHLRLHVLPEFLQLLLLGFELEVELFDAVGELFVVDLELELGDLGCVQVLLVHFNKINAD